MALFSSWRRYLVGGRYGDPIIVVSGLPRSGTSMAMKMLGAGGVELLTDEVRRPDADNPRGYFELEGVKSLGNQADKSWLGGARGKAVKVISHLLMELPEENAYRVVFMNRRIQEVIRSQNKMLTRRGEALSGDDRKVASLFRQHLAQLRPWLRKQHNFAVLELDYSEVVVDPRRGAARIAHFLERELDLEAMAAAVDPRLYRNRAK